MESGAGDIENHDCEKFLLNERRLEMTCSCHGVTRNKMLQVWRQHTWMAHRMSRTGHGNMSI